MLQSSMQIGMPSTARREQTFAIGGEQLSGWACSAGGASAALGPSTPSAAAWPWPAALASTVVTPTPGLLPQLPCTPPMPMSAPAAATFVPVSGAMKPAVGSPVTTLVADGAGVGAAFQPSGSPTSSDASVPSVPTLHRAASSAGAPVPCPGSTPSLQRLSLAQGLGSTAGSGGESSADRRLAGAPCARQRFDVKSEPHAGVSELTDPASSHALPHAAYLTPSHLRRGKGGRQPASNPLLDPKIDPKRARRILANRLSAARSKMKQKTAVAAARQHLDALKAQRDQLATELAAASAAADAAEAGTSLLLRELHAFEAGTAAWQLQAQARVPLAGWRGTAAAVMDPQAGA